MSCGVDSGSIGIVSPYRSQVEALKGRLHTSSMSEAGDKRSIADVSTVDKFQGRDMEVMILSLVRSNTHGSVGTLLRDWRRVNVAVTRAKYKLVIVGSMSITGNVPILKSLGELMKLRGYVLDLNLGDVSLVSSVTTTSSALST